MWRAFQTADRVSAGDTASACNPSDTRWAFTSLITAFARSVRAAAQDAPGVQSPTSVVAGAGAGAATSDAATAAATTASETGRSGGRSTSEAGTVVDRSAETRRFLSRSSHAWETLRRQAVSRPPRGGSPSLHHEAMAIHS